MARFDDYSDHIRMIRSLLIVTSLQKKDDLKIAKTISSYKKPLEWNLDRLLIDPTVWQYISSTKKYDPKLVFCHPEIIMTHPRASLYYRGLCGLSLKAAKDYCGSSIDVIENKGGHKKLTGEVAVKIAQTYNYFICSVINNTFEWTIENGHRTIIASLGITIDGKMRNKIGDIAEERIKAIIIEWLKKKNLIIKPDIDRISELEGFPAEVELPNRIIMRFASEPDIAFYIDDMPQAVIEIKGGIDPAGALERYGAATKSFMHAIDQSKGGNPRCKNFYVAATYTKELISRIKGDRLVERYFNIIDLLDSEKDRIEFLSEIFVYTLRLTN
jgi:hypothetical protein